MALYQDVLKVKEYFLFDHRASTSDLSFRGNRLFRGNYRRIRAVRGRLPSEVLQLHLEVHGELLRFFRSGYRPTIADSPGNRSGTPKLRPRRGVTPKPRSSDCTVNSKRYGDSRRRHEPWRVALPSCRGIPYNRVDTARRTCSCARRSPFIKLIRSHQRFVLTTHVPPTATASVRFWPWPTVSAVRAKSFA